ncbi:hypothetical protein ABB37_00415 [Leptomonas pyrrhocoris]|uniref:Uncharacterized protein n=1 Tax=Leptomonas pyrrhocoris TaxID=157538 RepID=A0A0M9GAN6_LEPPY|nr:hypothetical protein ABB37_00415 [Leptomonas pyrrhocoris]KPA86166.1 hypothetical protein ABB37_00415 [Leptomonas pyrrhocoris]|eukprot:XP_015664605.1 hypothetical protein ABB37_00415 [Leptomonas pyrrhocoris]
MSHNESAASALPQSGVKKLRFDDAATETPSASDGGVTSGRSARKSSPTISSVSPFASSLRRPSEAPSSHSDAHVQLNPNPEVIQHDGSVTTLAASIAHADAHPLPAVEEPAGEVANFLADVGAGLSVNNGASSNSISAASGPTVSGGSFNVSSTAVGGGNGSWTADSTARSATPDASVRFRTLLLQLSALILEHRPKDPEQYIVDHLNACLLSASVISRAPLNELDAGQKSKAGGDASLAEGHASRGAELSLQGPPSTAETAAAFQPFGDTVVERLASNVLSTKVGHSVLLSVAELLISTQPDDPEDFLWSRLEARSFGEEASHNITMNADGFPVVRPEDPAQLALLKDIPASSPGYVIAVNLLPVLFAKKPADPISYLFYHVANRARSSAVPSAHSSTRHLRVNADEEDDFEVESCTSREFGEDSYSGAEDVVETGSVSESANQLPLQRKGSLGSLFDAAAAASGTIAVAGQSLRRSTGDRGLGGRHRQSHGRTNSRGSSVRRSTAPTAGSSRALKDSSNPPSVPDELSALFSSATKRVSIAQQEVQLPSPSHFSYDSSALPGNNAASNGTGGASITNSGAAAPTRSSRDTGATAEPQVCVGTQYPPASAPAHPANGTLRKVEAEEHARIRQEFDLLRLREELRLERLQYEVRTLTRECEYRTRMAMLNKTDRMADRAAAASREALEEAHTYRGFLCAQIDQLDGEQQRQLRTVSQHIGRMAFPVQVAASALPSPSFSTLLGEDAAFRQAEQQHVCGSTSTYSVPSELDILKKQVELLTMEQARAKHHDCVSAAFNPYASTQQNRYRPAAIPGAQTSARPPYSVQ